MVASCSLLALTWASAALATPLIAEPLAPRDATKCPSQTDYTSKNGLKFTVSCKMDNYSNNLEESAITSTFEECFERCSRWRGNDSPQKRNCYAAVWNQDNYCHLKGINSTTYPDQGSPINNAMAKVTNADDLKSGNVACPVTSGSTQSLDLGAEGRVEYKVLCNNTIDSNDRVWGEFPKMDEPFALFYHADSLEECVKWGTKSHPISNAVVYNPDLKFGYANCIPKANAPQENQRQPSRNEAVMHTAIITSRDNNQTPNATCQNPNTYTSSSTSSRQQFTITCGQDLSPNSPNITLIHTQNITACIDTCAASKDKGCVGVVFDSSLQQGFQNCYLKNSTLVGASLPFATYAVAAGHSAEPTPGNSNSKGEDTDKSDGDGGGSKAWIAGAVVGGLVGLALIGAAIWFLRRRKITPAHASSVGPTQEFYGGSERYAHNAGGSAYMPVQGSSGSYMAELDAGAAQQNELHGVSSSEMKKPRELPA